MSSEGLRNMNDAIAKKRQRIRSEAQKALRLLKEEIREGEQREEIVIVGYEKRPPNILFSNQKPKTKSLEEIWEEEDFEAEMRKES